MPSKQITDRQKSALAVSAASETQAGATGGALGSILKPYLAKGKLSPTWLCS